MYISDISIKKPVFAWMLMTALIIFGVIGFFRMGISQLPDVDFPVVTVSVGWVGASPETMESAVADVIEDAVMSVEGIRNVSSTCQEGLSTTTVEFELSRNIDVALQEVQTKIAQAQKSLPTDVDPPIVTKSNPEDQPIIWAALSGPNPLREKMLFVRDHLKDQLTTIQGVGNVRFGGYVDPNMRVWLNTHAMRDLQISVDDIIATINSGTILTPSGFMDNGSQETNVRILSEISSPEAFSQLLIPARSGQPIWRPIRLGQVAKIEEGLADIRRISRINGEPAVGLGVIKQRGSNAVSIGNAVQEKMKKLAGLLPSGMKLTTVVDSTQFIKESTHELIFTLGLSALLTSVVCYLFLGSLSSALNVVLAIPTSLLGAFIFLSLLGFTLNTFTLLALSLSIGIVVDDAIMVLENIVRYFEQGMGRVKASFLGAREITSAATAASVAVLAIFLPVIFMKGIIGKYLFQFGVAMSVAVMLSLLEALTLAPMRCSQFLERNEESRVTRAMNRFMAWLSRKYRRLLEACLSHRWKVVVGSLVIFAVSLALLPGLRKEFVPAQDQSRFMATLQTPLGSSLEFTDEVFKQAGKILATRPEVESYFVAIGGFQGGLVNQGNMFINLKDPNDRAIHPPFSRRPTQQEVMALIREEFKKIKGVSRATVLDLSQAGFTAQRGFPVTFSIQGPSWEKIAEASSQMMAEMGRSGLMTDIDSDYNPKMPELRILPDREKAAAKGVTISNIANSISALVGSLRIGKYTDESGHRDDIRIKLLDQFNRSPQDIKEIWIRNNRGEMISLSDVVKLSEDKSLLTISRYNRERAVTVFANVAPGKSQADATQFVQTLSERILPQGYHLVFSGSSQTFKESFDSLWVAFALGVLIAYMVLGAQFNSFVHPITILLALPFCLTGAFVALKLTGISLNIYSMIGLLLLMGIAKKNSILLVEFANQKREGGLGVHEALLEASPIRLRPILMTSFATLAAAVPASLALGPGAETARPMAVVVIGGVLLSTLFTLFVVPCAYSLMSWFERRHQDKEIRRVLSEV